MAVLMSAGSPSSWRMLGPRPTLLPLALVLLLLPVHRSGAARDVPAQESASSLPTLHMTARGGSGTGKVNLTLSAEEQQQQQRRQLQGVPGLGCNWGSKYHCTNDNGFFTATVDDDAGAGMSTPQHYINGIFSLDMKLYPGYSGGIDFAWYLIDSVTSVNTDPNHSEIDIEFFGGDNSKDFTLALNIYCNGMQNLAHFKLPFDPSAAFHTYTIKWNVYQIVWMIDWNPIRIVNRKAGQPWPTRSMQPMASAWRTPWTVHQADFKGGPVVAWYKNYQAWGCLAGERDIQQGGDPYCDGPWNDPTPGWKLANYGQVQDWGWVDARWELTK